MASTDDREEREDKRADRHDDREDQRLLRHDRRVLNGRWHLSHYIVAFTVIVAVALSTVTLVLLERVHENTTKLSLAAKALIVHTHQIDQLNDQQDAAALGECLRVNLLRAQANRNTVALYAALKAVANHISQDITGEFPVPKALRISDLHALEREAGKITTTALTDCKQAAAHPLTYRPPTPKRIGPLHP